MKVPIDKSNREIERVAALTSKKKPKAKKGKGKRKANEDDGDSGNDYEDGSKAAGRINKDEIIDWTEHVHQYDVVITTYSVLRSEIWVARPPPDRPKREDAVYSPYHSRSPLVLVKWKRVVMDEVQMVGGGQAASVLHFLWCGSKC